MGLNTGTLNTGTSNSGAGSDFGGGYSNSTIWTSPPSYFHSRLYTLVTPSMVVVAVKAVEPGVLLQY